MTPLAIPYPSFDPVAFQIGPVAVRWYGLAYMAGLLLGWYYIRRLAASPRLWRGSPALTVDQTDNLLIYVTLGVVIGGRLGSVLLYDLPAYLANPLEIFALWHGGMAFHGGLLGVLAAILLFARRNAVDPLSTGDLVTAAVPIGLFFGRLANFVNGELWGRISDVPWAMVFPDPGAGLLPRHPSQLYEAALEGAALFALLAWLVHGRLKLRQPGFVTGTFLAGYGLARSFCELFRQGDSAWFVHSEWLTAGMMYSLPMIAIGAWLMRYASRQDGRASPAP